MNPPLSPTEYKAATPARRAELRAWAKALRAGPRPPSLREVGEALGITKQMVSRICLPKYWPKGNGAVGTGSTKLSDTQIKSLRDFAAPGKYLFEILEFVKREFKVEFTKGGITYVLNRFGIEYKRIVFRRRVAAPPGYLSIPDYSDLKTKSTHAVLNAVKQHRIPAIKVGNAWYIHKDTKWVGRVEYKRMLAAKSDQIVEAR